MATYASNSKGGVTNKETGQEYKRGQTIKGTPIAGYSEVTSSKGVSYIVPSNQIQASVNAIEAGLSGQSNAPTTQQATQTIAKLATPETKQEPTAPATKTPNKAPNLPYAELLPSYRANSALFEKKAQNAKNTALDYGKPNVPKSNEPNVSRVPAGAQDYNIFNEQLKPENVLQKRYEQISKKLEKVQPQAEALNRDINQYESLLIDVGASPSGIRKSDPVPISAGVANLISNRGAELNKKAQALDMELAPLNQEIAQYNTASKKFEQEQATRDFIKVVRSAEAERKENKKLQSLINNPAGALGFGEGAVYFNQNAEEIFNKAYVAGYEGDRITGTKGKVLGLLAAQRGFINLTAEGVITAPRAATETALGGIDLLGKLSPVQAEFRNAGYTREGRPLKKLGLTYEPVASIDVFNTYQGRTRAGDIKLGEQALLFGASQVDFITKRPLAFAGYTTGSALFFEAAGIGIGSLTRVGKTTAQAGAIKLQQAATSRGTRVLDTAEQTLARGKLSTEPSILGKLAGEQPKAYVYTLYIDTKTNPASLLRNPKNILDSKVTGQINLYPDRALPYGTNPQISTAVITEGYLTRAIGKKATGRLFSQIAPDVLKLESKYGLKQIQKPLIADVAELKLSYQVGKKSYDGTIGGITRVKKLEQGNIITKDLRGRQQPIVNLLGEEMQTFKSARAADRYQSITEIVNLSPKRGADKIIGFGSTKLKETRAFENPQAFKGMASYGEVERMFKPKSLTLSQFEGNVYAGTIKELGKNRASPRPFSFVQDQYRKFSQRPNVRATDLERQYFKDVFIDRRPAPISQPLLESPKNIAFKTTNKPSTPTPRAERRGLITQSKTIPRSASSSINVLGVQGAKNLATFTSQAESFNFASSIRTGQILNLFSARVNRAEAAQRNRLSIDTLQNLSTARVSDSAFSFSSTSFLRLPTQQTPQETRTGQRTSLSTERVQIPRTTTRPPTGAPPSLPFIPKRIFEFPKLPSSTPIYTAKRKRKKTKRATSQALRNKSFSLPAMADLLTINRQYSSGVRVTQPRQSKANLAKYNREVLRGGAQTFPTQEILSKKFKLPRYTFF